MNWKYVLYAFLIALTAAFTGWLIPTLVVAVSLFVQSRKSAKKA
jgi:hypothetical protein